MLHVVLAPGPEAVGTGMRVRAVWAEARVGHVRDLLGFEPVEAA